MRASAQKWMALSSLIALGSAPAALAQGMMEYGGALGGGTKLGSTGILNSPWAKAGQNFGSGGGVSGASQRGGTLNVPNRRPVVDQETADAYAALSNKVYLQARKKEAAGQLTEAYTMYGHSADLRVKVWGNTDPAVLEIYKAQAKIAVKQNKLPQAEDTYRKMLSIVGRKNGPGSPEAKPIVSSLASIFEKQKKYSDAASMYKQLVAMEARASGESGAEVLKTRMKLAHSYIAAKNITDAEASLKETIATVDAMPAPDTKTLVAALQTYSSLLKQEGRQDEAAPLDNRVAALGGGADTGSPTAGADKAAAPAAPAAAPTAPAAAPTATKAAPAATAPTTPAATAPTTPAATAPTTPEAKPSSATAPAVPGNK